MNSSIRTNPTNTKNMKMMLNNDSRQGIFFGINSGILATVGIIAGLSQTTNNPMYVVISVLSLAISDCTAEAYSMYLSKKAEILSNNTNAPLFSSLGVFLAKCISMLVFLTPLLFDWNIKYFKNLWWPSIYSIIVLLIVDYNLAEMRNESKTQYIVNHMILLSIIVISTKLVGNVLSKY